MATLYPGVVTTALVVCSVLFPIISAFSIFLRVVACRKSRQRLQTDDYWIAVSWVLTFALSIIVWIYAAKAGVNYYNVDFLTGTEASLELVFISSCYITFPLAAVKISVLLFYKRIFTTRIFSIIVWIAIGVVSIWAVLFFLLVLLEIKPISFPLTTVALRFDTTALGLAQAASSFTLDIIVLCLPLPVISRLNMKRQRKIAVALIFWLGAFCVVTAVVRTALLDESIGSVVSSKEHVASQSKQYIFMVLEPNCSILAACLPTYGPLMAGGRGPESIVRSVRSIFSLRSLRGSGSGSGNSRPNHRQYMQNSELTPQRDNGAAESQVELRGVQDWPGKNLQEVSISGHTVPPVQSDEQNQTGIYVKNDFTVERG